MILKRIFAVAALTAFASAATSETVLRFSTLAPPNTPWMAHFQGWADNVAQASDGELRIEIYPSGQLGNEFEVYRQVQRGRIDAAAFAGSILAEKIPEFALMSTPFLFDDISVIDCVYDGAFGDQLRQRVDDENLTFMQWGETGWVHVFAKEDLTDVASAQGYKIRVAPQPMSRLLWDSVDADGTEIPFAEMPPALQTGLVRGGEASEIAFVATGLGRSAPHLMKTAHMHQAGIMVISGRSWQKLSAEQQQILRDAMPSVSDLRGSVRHVAGKLLDKYAASGAPIHELTEAERAAWKDKVAPGWPGFVAELGGDAETLWPMLMEAKTACEG